MRRKLFLFTALAGSAALLLTSCAANQPAVSPSTTPGLPVGGEVVELDPAAFSTTIDNPYWPMDPGTQWTFRETDAIGMELSVVITVTDQTKVIANGIEARVVRDTVRRGGDIVEDTFDWYAQDADGAIWYLGEQTAEFESGEIVSTHGSFEAGVDGALPGVVIPANPQPGMTYRQEYYEGEAEDNGEIMSVTEVAEAPYGFFENVLATRDTITIEPGVLQYKFYAIGIGPVLVLDVAGGSGREELLSINQVPSGTGTGPLGQPD